MRIVTSHKIQDHKTTFQLYFIRLAICCAFVFQFNSLKANEFYQFIDSIEQVNKTVHDTVKIDNYIKIYKKQDGLYLDTCLFFLNKALEIDELYNYKTNNLLIFKGRIYYDKNDFVESFKLRRLSLDYARNNDEKILSYLALYLNYISLNLYDDAFDCINKGLELFEVTQDSLQLSNLLLGKGYYYLSIHKYKNAIPYFLSAINIKNRHRDAKYLYETYANLASAYSEIGEYDSALSINFKVLNYYKSKIKMQSYILYNIGFILNRQGNSLEALKYIKQSLEIDKKYNDNYNITYDLHYLGVIHSDLGNSNLALKYYYQALELAKKINEQDRIRDICTDLFKT